MKDFLINFVNSLTSREKAAFRKYAAMHSEDAGKNYMRIYEQLEKRPRASMEEIRESFQGESIYKYWSSERNYLFQQLMNSLTNFHKTTSHYRRLTQMVLFIDILFEKGFREKAGKILRQAKKLAYRFEEFSIILRLIEQEEEVIFYEGILGFADQLQILGNERQRVVDQIQNMNELRLIREQVRSLQFTESFVNNPEQYPHIFANPLLDSLDRALSVKAKENWYYIKSIQEYILRRFDVAYENQKIYQAYFEAHQHLFKKARKLPIVSNTLFMAVLNKDVQGFKKGLRQLEVLERDPLLDTVYLRFIKYARLLDLYYITESWEAMEKELLNVGTYLLESAGEMGEAQVGYLVELVVRSYILLEQYEQSMEWVRFWYQVPQLEVNASLRRIFSLITYQELGYEQLLESEVTSSYKELKKIKRLGPLEQAFIQYCRQCLREPANKGEFLQQLTDQLLIISKDPESNKDFVYFDFYQWGKKTLDRTRNAK